MYWPGWVSGLVLSVLIVLYFWVTGRLLSSSGRVSMIVDRMRLGPDALDDASPEEIAAAMRRASIEAFGEEAVAEAESRALVEREPEQEHATRPRAKVTWLGHLAFLTGLLVAGRVSRSEAPFSWTLGEGVWAGTLPESALPAVLLIAGVLVGFGTRMAGGCPLGHGLIGMARGQRGSIASGLSFFAAGVGATWLLGLW